MSGGLVPSIDFTPLSRLGQTLATGLRENERRNALQGLGVSPGDPNFLPKLGQTLVGLGDIDGALTVSRLQEASQDRTYQRGRDARQDAFQERTFSVGRQDVAENRARQDRLDARSTDQEKLRNYYLDQGDKRAQEQLELQRQQAARKAVPNNFEVDPDNPNGVRPVVGGPEDPAYVARRKQAEASAKTAEEKALPAELGARVALSQSFLDAVPELRAKVKAGGVTGIWDRSMAEAGRGEQGEILRRIRSGSEAIVRNLTGAGMNQSEAEARVKQYEPGRLDSADTVVNKLDMLTEQLQRIEAEAYRGRGIPANRRGKNPFFEPERAPATQAGAAPAAAPSSNPRLVPLDQIKENQRFRRDGRIYRRVNGQDVPE